jgi:hypothetical protein
MLNDKIEKKNTLIYTKGYKTKKIKIKRIRVNMEIKNKLEDN